MRESKLLVRLTSGGQEGGVAMASKKPALSPLPEFASMSAGTTALGEIVVFIDGRVDAADILEFASALTKEHDARLIGVFMEPASEATPAQTFARGKGVVSVIEEQQAQLGKIVAEHHAQFEDIVRRHGIRSEWKSLPYLSGEVGAHAYYAELVVVALPKSAAQTAGPPGLAESLILSSGRPIILFPPDRAVSQVDASWWHGTPRGSPSVPWRTLCRCLSKRTRWRF